MILMNKRITRVSGIDRTLMQFAAAFIVLANDDALFRASLLVAAGAIVGSPKEAKELSAIAKLSAMSKMFGTKKPES